MSSKHESGNYRFRNRRRIDDSEGRAEVVAADTPVSAPIAVANVNALANHAPPNQSAQIPLDIVHIDTASTKGMNEILTEDCIAHVLTEIDDFTDLISKSMVCKLWLDAVRAVLKSATRTSLKLVDNVLDLEYYRKVLIHRWRLDQTSDPRFALCAQYSDYTPQEAGQAILLERDDVLMFRALVEVSLALITYSLRYLFIHVTFLVISTRNIVEVEILCAFKDITTLTLIELPDSRAIQRDMWRQLATMTELRHLHIFHANAEFPIPEDQIAPVLGQLQSFSLVDYRHCNMLQLVGHLSPERARALRLGNFHCVGDSWEFNQLLKIAYPALVASLNTRTFFPIEIHLYGKCGDMQLHQAAHMPEQFRAQFDAINNVIVIELDQPYEIERQQLDHIDQLRRNRQINNMELLIVEQARIRQAQQLLLQEENDIEEVEEEVEGLEDIWNEIDPFDLHQVSDED